MRVFDHYQLKILVPLLVRCTFCLIPVSAKSISVDSPLNKFIFPIFYLCSDAIILIKLSKIKINKNFCITSIPMQRSADSVQTSGIFWFVHAAGTFHIVSDRADCRVPRQPWRRLFSRNVAVLKVGQPWKICSCEQP